jgi:hypothetical protein
MPRFEVFGVTSIGYTLLVGTAESLQEAQVEIAKYMARHPDGATDFRVIVTQQELSGFLDPKALQNSPN